MMKRSRWPLLLIAAPAAVAIWGGWVGLGQLAGFGTIRPLPGIFPWHLDTAITLPVGIEAYGVYALRAWLDPAGVPDRARVFARRSALGALALGMCGQVIFHLLAAAGADRAPWPVTVLVSCVPVVTLGFAAALTHLLRDAPGAEPESEHENTAEDEVNEINASAPEPEPVPEPEPETVPERPRPARSRAKSAPVTDWRTVFAPEVEAGTLPSDRQVRDRMRVGGARAAEIRREMAAAGLNHAR